VAGHPEPETGNPPQAGKNQPEGEKK